jgi:hypothetical protein
MKDDGPKRQDAEVFDKFFHFTLLSLAATCSALEHFEHGDRVLKFGDGTGYGTVFAFECEPGYRRVGAATMLCQTNGTWSAVQPRCESMG